MLLAFSRDLRVVLLRLASRLQTLRFFAASKTPCPPRSRRRGDAGVRAARQPARHLADQVGARGPRLPLPRPRAVPDRSRGCSTRGAPIARRASRRCAPSLAADLAAQGLAAQVQGRPKHLYSIWKKMRGKRLDFAQVLDVRRAARHRRRRRRDCYAVLGRVHERYRADRRRARRLHRAAEGERLPLAAHRRRRATTAARSRSRSAPREMHEHAEYGVSAHWAYKEADAARCRASAPAARSRRRSRRRGSSCCASCSPGSATSPATATRMAGATTDAADARSLRRPHLRLHAAGGGGRARRRARRRSTSPTRCTPTSAIAAAAPRSTARWCR